MTGWEILSSALGASYFLIWSFSFYPQAIHNYRRKSTTGLSPDYALLNPLGYIFLSIYTLSLYLSPTARAQYAERNAGKCPEVTLADVGFAVHALGISGVILGQVGWYNWDSIRSGRTMLSQGEETGGSGRERARVDGWFGIRRGRRGAERRDGGAKSSSIIPDERRPLLVSTATNVPDSTRQPTISSIPHPASTPCSPSLCPTVNPSPTKLHSPSPIHPTLLGAISLLTILFGTISSTYLLYLGRIQYLDWLYFASAVKLGVNAVKYVPQVLLNIRLKSLRGFAIGNILLDMPGSILSFLQLVISSIFISRYPPGILANPAKLGLAALSFGFDVIFISQYYVFYRDGNSKGKDDGDERFEA